ncbi:MAG: SulP family inorganic anion transporter [Deltaproteobacteria bacterium]|nr:SulP family inorganic anion transporter [Deltaproteobacteria bacterium]
MSFRIKFRPKLLDCLAGYNFKSFSGDLSAGLTVGVIALPMAMAFGIASGVAPEAGIITAVIAGFLTSFFGGSRVSIGGPTGAFVAIVAGIVSGYGLSGLLICTMMAGVILLAMGLAHLGALIRFIPAPLIRGFTTGIAIIILCGQLKDFFGIQATLGDTSNAIATIISLLPHMADISLPTLVTATICLLGFFFWPRKLARYIPGSIGMMIIATVAVQLLSLYFDLGIETIGSRFGGIPRSLPSPGLPAIDLATFQNLLAPAMTIAILGAIESLLCATAADGMIDDEHDPDQELMAQGIANFVSPLFGGIPATGAIARTAANIRCGGRSPLAGMIHALVLLGIMLLAAPLAKFIPLAVLSAILIQVAINMGDWREFILLPRYPKGDAAVFLLTFLLTVVFGLTEAVTVGMLAACIMFIRDMSSTSLVGLQPIKKHIATGGYSETERGETGNYRTHDEVMVLSLSGALFFGAAQKLKRGLSVLRNPPKVLIINMSQVISLDATAIYTLEDIVIKSKRKGVTILLAGLRKQPRHWLLRAGLLEDVPRKNILHDMEHALQRAHDIIDAEEAAKNTPPEAAHSGLPEAARSELSEAARCELAKAAHTMPPETENQPGGPEDSSNEQPETANNTAEFKQKEALLTRLTEQNATGQRDWARNDLYDK